MEADPSTPLPGRRSGSMKVTVRTPENESRPVWSHSCALDDLVAPYAIDPAVAERLDTKPGWARRWTARTEQAVQELAGIPGLPGMFRSDLGQLT